jgi:hypothetical protein
MDVSFGVEVVFREWERVSDLLDAAREDLARLDRKHRLAVDAFEETRGKLVERVGVLGDRVDGLRAALDVLGEGVVE